MKIAVQRESSFLRRKKVTMAQKRPLISDPRLELPLKNPRYENDKDDHDGSKLVSFSESVLAEHAPKKRHLTGDDESLQYDDIHDGDEETATVDGTAQEPSERSVAVQDVIEVPPRVCLGAEDLDPDNPISKRARLIDIYKFFLGHPPLKSIPTGSNHQADIPDWNSTKNNHESEAASASNSQEDERFFPGTCILQMPDSDSNISDEVGKVRTDCSCGDTGSVRCVKQHIVEARERLKESLGMGRFRQLGLDKMGESVNRTWSQLEEQLFLNVVVSNPKTKGKNFWQTLRWIWPLRPKQDLVSYYFNVYMLRRRAQQNRFHRLNNDSDDDLWPWEAYRNEIEMVETDGESGSESPGTP